MISQFPQVWQEQLKTLGFSELTDIQKQVFEPISQGDNLLGTSPTGTGKTLAYLFPALLKLKPKKFSATAYLSSKHRVGWANF